MTASRTFVCAGCGREASAWGPTWRRLETGETVCGGECAKRNDIAGILAGLTLYDEERTPQGRVLSHPDRATAERLADAVGAPRNWMYRQGETWKIRLFGRRQG